VVRSVVEAEGVTQAIHTLRATAVDLMVLDLHLRSESALALVPLARCERPGIVVVVVTNQPSMQHRRECLALGADYFFDKSREVEELLGAVALAARPTRGVA
jgi:DNA-binding NarL/FixJ family response regulator